MNDHARAPRPDKIPVPDSLIRQQFAEGIIKLETGELPKFFLEQGELDDAAVSVIEFLKKDSMRVVFSVEPGELHPDAKEVRLDTNFYQKSTDVTVVNSEGAPTTYEISTYLNGSHIPHGRLIRTGPREAPRRATDDEMLDLMRMLIEGSVQDRRDVVISKDS